MGNQAGSPRKKKGEKGGILVPGGSGDACPSKLVSGMFDLRLIGHHGLPSQPSRICYVPMLGLLVVATGYQQLKVYGHDGLEIYVPCREDQGRSTGVSSFSAGATATFLDYTSSGKVVLVMSDSAVQVIDLALLQQCKDVVVAALPSSWTTSRITAVETIRHHKDTPFFYLALDDGSVQVVHETTCHFASYAIYPGDVGVAGSKDQADAIFVSAMACSPTDPNQLLLAYEASDVVYVWDVAKQRVLLKTQSSLNPSPVRSLAWHASGKRFAAIFASGAIGVSRSDKQQQAVYTVDTFLPPGHASAASSRVAQSLSNASVVHQRIFWLTTHAASPGALIVSSWNSLTISYPARDAQKGPKEALSELSTPSKHGSFPWQTTVLPTQNNSSAMDFAIASAVVPAASSSAPFTAIVLAGNPLDGVKPSLAMHMLPCLLAQPHTPKEEWIWIPSPPVSSPISPTSHHLQSCDVLAMHVLDLRTADNGAFRDDLFSSQPILHDDEQASSSSEEGRAGIPVATWTKPLTGGATTIEYPSLPRLLLSSSTDVDDDSATDSIKERHTKRACWIVTAHADSRVKIWESLPPAHGASRGQLNLLHVLHVKSVLQDSISQVSFSPTSRLLVVGTLTGNVAFFTYTSGAGFTFVFSLHVHSSAIERIAMTRTCMDVALSDACGVVSIVHVASQTYKLVIFDLALDDESNPGSVDSLLLHGSSLFVGRGNGRVQVYDVPTAALLLTCRTDESANGSGGVSSMLLMDETGRGDVSVEALTESSLHAGGGDSSAAPSLSVDAATQALVDNLVGAFPSPSIPYDESRCITVCVDAGPLGIFLVDDVADRAVLKEFVEDNANAQLQQGMGIVPGSTLVRINGVDVGRLKKADVVAVVGSLASVAKQLTYHLPVDPAETRSPYLVCARGRSIQVYHAPVPPACMPTDPDDAAKNEVVVRVDAAVELRAAVATMAITAIPVEGRMEHALVALDQTGCVYVLALPSLVWIWSASCPSDVLAGYAFDHTHVHINASGTIVLGTDFGDVAEYSIFHPDMLADVTMLQWASTNTQVVAPQIPLQGNERNERVVEKKGSGFLKLFAAKEVDLNTVEHSRHVDDC
ncbi:hypothetical protein, variant [Aphanomyces invadans]|uniref:Uncharacterized protein n=1 Tax=Aphanomyces invadans TaxID=157072 RepID=A0A024UK35_9STRA|nr:hypothetical protein, variant [Aphanomyces invadans]ETW06535.1 hypothetical protein, variant [Aphanomyces invadans]|eukprot:XP_008864610.1 hypothetical protein, variant [Aphanomyces invadans]